MSADSSSEGGVRVEGAPRTDAIDRRLDRVRSQIEQSCARADRDPSDVTVVVVTKTHPPEVVRAVVELGLHHVGESRVQEMEAKRERVASARWHVVGRLQRNKAGTVAGRVELIHSVDRPELAAAVAAAAVERGARQRVLLQVNVGGDPRKAGCAPGDALALAATIRREDGLELCGFMAMPPLAPESSDPNEHARPYFARLREIRDEAGSLWPEVHELSIGMSADFEAAIEEGATIVRLGTAVLGPRSDPPWEPRLP